MEYLCLIGSVFFVAFTSVCGGFYNRKTDGKKGASSLYNLLILGSVFLCWLILFLFDLEFEWSVLPYSILFGICYAVCAIATIYALKTGPILLTSLILQLSIIAVAIWGFIAGWQVPQWWTWVGLVLVVIALWLCLKTDDKKEESASVIDGKTLENNENQGGRYETKLSFKWLIFVALMFFGNAGCSITQRTQQMAYDGKYGNFLMVTAMIIGVATCVVMYLRDDKSDSREILKTTWVMPVLAGVVNVLLNLAVMYMATSTLSPSLIYPVMAVGGLIVTTLFSAFVFKEKMYWGQWVGVAIGMVATAILSI